MHRTEGEDYAPNGNGSGKPGYQPASPPTQPATRLPAEAMNAIQEEIANVIELAGGSLASSAANDRTAGWRQLYDAIFNGFHGTTNMLSLGSVLGNRITDDSISDSKLETGISFSKLLGELSQSQIDAGDTEAMEIKFDNFMLRLTNGGITYESAMHNQNGFTNQVQEAVNTYNSKLNGYGLSFFNDKAIAHKIVSFVSADFTGATKEVAYIDTGVPIDKMEPIDAKVSWELASAAGGYDAPNRIIPRSDAAVGDTVFEQAVFTIPTGLTTWQLQLRFDNNTLFADSDISFVDKKAVVYFREI